MVIGLPCRAWTRKLEMTRPSSGSHAGPVAVEDAHDPDVEAVVGVVGHRHRLGESLGLVVDPTWPHRVHVAPVVLGLGMDLGIAVDLAGGRQEEAGRLGPGQAEAVVGPEAADLEGLDRHLEVVLGRRRRGEVHDGVDRARHPDVGGDVELDVGEAGGAEEVLDVVHVAGDEVVDGDDLVAAREQTLAQVRPEEAGTAGDDHACHCQYTPSAIRRRERQRAAGTAPAEPETLSTAIRCSRRRGT